MSEFKPKFRCVYNTGSTRFRGELFDTYEEAEAAGRGQHSVRIEQFSIEKVFVRV